jgi:hypothetical protein
MNRITRPVSSPEVAAAIKALRQDRVSPGLVSDVGARLELAVETRRHRIDVRLPSAGALPWLLGIAVAGLVYSVSGGDGAPVSPAVQLTAQPTGEPLAPAPATSAPRSRPVRTTPRAQAATLSAKPSRLAEELAEYAAIEERARTLDGHAALVDLDGFLARRPDATLLPEALALRLELLVAIGAHREAAHLAMQLARTPGAPRPAPLLLQAGLELNAAGECTGAEAVLHELKVAGVGVLAADLESALAHCRASAAP